MLSLLWREAAKFGIVGGLGWLIDNGIYAVLHMGAMSGSTLKARVVSSSIAILFSWYGNRYWTFRHRPKRRTRHEFLLFIVISLIGLGIALACQFVSHYLLGFQTLQADIISGGVIGLVLGTIFRFIAYRFVVFKDELDDDPDFREDRVAVPGSQDKQLNHPTSEASPPSAPDRKSAKALR